MIQFKENAWREGRTEGWKDRWKDGQTLFYKTILATAGGPKKKSLSYTYLVKQSLVYLQDLTHTFKIFKKLF